MFTFCGSLDLVVYVYKNISNCSELPRHVIWTLMWVIEATFSYSQLPQSSLSGGRSLVQQIHNLCNLKNTCDHESKWEWETQKHWGSLVMPILCFGKNEYRSSAGQLPCQTRPITTSLFCSIVRSLQFFFSQTTVHSNTCFLYYQRNGLVHSKHVKSNPLF